MPYLPRAVQSLGAHNTKLLACVSPCLPRELRAPQQIKGVPHLPTAALREKAIRARTQAVRYQERITDTSNDNVCS